MIMGRNLGLVWQEFLKTDICSQEIKKGRTFFFVFVLKDTDLLNSGNKERFSKNTKMVFSAFSQKLFSRKVFKNSNQEPYMSLISRWSRKNIPDGPKILKSDALIILKPQNGNLSGNG